MTELPSFLLGHPALFVLGVFLSLLGCIGLGRALGKRDRSASGDAASPGLGLIEGSVFALLGLLVAFTLSGAASRLEARRALVVAEANAIGTARLRIDLLPPDARPAMQGAFDRYVRSRNDSYRITDPAAFRAALKRSTAIQAEIWGLATEAGRRPDALPSANMLLLPALNEMIDITTTRAMALKTHTPAIIYFVIWMSALAASILAGFEMAAASSRSWLPILAFAVVMTTALYVLVDLEYPRMGLIRIDDFERLLIEGAP